MGIFDRLEEVIKSYLNDDDGRSFDRSSPNQRQAYTDPDLEAAYKELNDYLKGGSAKKKSASFDTGNFYTQKGQTQGSFDRREPLVPESIRQDFAELGLSPGASPEECKAAYKKLLKIHHPDRHAGHPGNMKKATEKSARINAAFDHIERWRQTGKAE
jgi:DnaJ-domain-containing protein 1